MRLHMKEKEWKKKEHFGDETCDLLTDILGNVQIGHREQFSAVHDIKNLNLTHEIKQLVRWRYSNQTKLPC